MPVKVRRGRIGDEGKGEFIVKVYAVVEVTSVPVLADNGPDAIRKAYEAIDFEKELRRVVPNQTVSKVAFTDQLNGAELWGSMYGVPIMRLMEFDEDELEEILND